MKNDTIFALASGVGKAGVAVFRISGPDAENTLVRLVGDISLCIPRQARLSTIVDAETKEVVDRGLSIWFPAPKSFTGENVVELQVHGGHANIARMLSLLNNCPGLRLAEPGEFTRRAFENGKMDLTAAEGLADLVNAETEAQRRQAFRQTQGELGQRYENWHQKLMQALAHTEASIDFSDEELPDDLDGRSQNTIKTIAQEIDTHLQDRHQGELLRDGVSLVIVGPPNVGKSSLLNFLAKRDVAIVSALAGTTRDIIEVRLDLAGYPVIVSDTAGLGTTAPSIKSDYYQEAWRSEGPTGTQTNQASRAVSAIEDEGIKRALSRAQSADLRLVMAEVGNLRHLDSWVEDVIDEKAILVVNKIDQKRPQKALLYDNHPVHGISVKTGEGIDNLLAVIEKKIAQRCCLSSAVLTRRRHRTALEKCLYNLKKALRRKEQELIAEHLRLSIRSLAAITGQVSVEEILDVVFHDFCIGK